MSLRHFHAPPESFSPGGSHVVLSREESQHLTQALRLGAGARVQVFDGEGREFLCEVADAGGRGGAVLGVVGRVEPPRAESPLALVLAAALLKGEKFDLVVQKATELGVVRVVPVETARAEVRGSREAGAARRAERWRRIALEAAKQSGRARVPEVGAPVGLEELFGAEPARAGARRVMFTERGGRGLVETVAAWGGGTAEVVALVGPEGGWEDGEIARAVESGWEAVTLGGRTLRAETACLVAVALLQHLCGDLR